MSVVFDKMPYILTSWILNPDILGIYTGVYTAIDRCHYFFRGNSIKIYPDANRAWSDAFFIWFHYIFEPTKVQPSNIVQSASIYYNST